MNRDHVYQMRGKRRVTGFRLRAVDPEACQRLLDDPAATDEELRVRVLLNHRYELLDAPVTMFRLVGGSSETEWYLMGIDPGRINRERLERRPPHLADYGPPPPGLPPAEPILLRPLYDVMTIETPDGWVGELIDGPDVEPQPGELEFEEACWEMRFHHDAFEAKVRAHQAARDELAASNNPLPEKTPEPLCTGYEVVCPDGRVRDYPYHNLGDAESTARLATKRQCRLYPEPSPLELSQPPCPEGEHVVRVVVFQEPQEAVIGQA